VVDYFLGSADVYDYAATLLVNKDTMFCGGTRSTSDHRPLQLHLEDFWHDCNDKSKQKGDVCHMGVKLILYKLENAELYAEKLDSKLQSCFQDRVLEQLDADELIQDVRGCVLEAAKEAHGEKIFLGNRNQARGWHRDQPWFDAECKKMKQELRQQQKADPNSSHLATVMARDNLRRLLRKKKREYRQKQDCSLRTLANKNRPNFGWRSKRKRRKTSKSGKMYWLPDLLICWGSHHAQALTSHSRMGERARSSTMRRAQT
jgi:hypothetical protein